MAIFEIISGPITHRYLMNKRRSDLERLLFEYSRNDELFKSDVSDAIMLLVRRINARKDAKINGKIKT